MKTPNLDKLRNGIKSLATPLQDIILCEKDVEYAEKAAAILAAMQARIEKLEAVRKAAQSHMDFHGKDRGISKTNDTLLDALFEARE